MSAESGGEPLTEAWVGALRGLQRGAASFVRRYHRLELEGELANPGEPVLFVANHGFGGIFDLNVFAVFATLEELKVDRPVTALTHQMAWTLKVGRLLEPAGAKPASRESARIAFAQGDHVLVFPGGDLEAFKPFAQRNQIVFAGRSGFADLAMEANVPVVPIVTIGAGESLLVLSDGQRLARWLRLDKTLRTKALPVSVSIPWGLSVGVAGLLPYLPLPAKLVTRVLPAMRPEGTETAQEFARRIEQAMQQALTDLAGRRRPWPG